jgi:hypothetical protein
MGKERIQNKSQRLEVECPTRGIFRNKLGQEAEGLGRRRENRMKPWGYIT